MTPTQFLHRILLPATDAFPLGDSPASRALLLAIAGQESGWTNRLQVVGPAHGFWQFELGTVASRGGVTGLTLHPAAGPLLKAFCDDWEIVYDASVIYQAITYCDPLAYACARLLLWTDPHPLPAVGAASDAWDYYIANWRPGEPRSETWAANYAAAIA